MSEDIPNSPAGHAKVLSEHDNTLDNVREELVRLEPQRKLI